MEALDPHDDNCGRLVARFHASPAQLVLAATGGAAGAIAALLSTPGGSRTVLECVVPYSAAALAEFLGRAPERYCSEATARAMAMVAFERARRLGAEWRRAIGLGVTASLASDRPKHGDHRLHVATQSAAATVVASLTLIKGRRSRAEEETLAAAFTLNQLAASAGVTERMPLDLDGAEQVIFARHDAAPTWQSLWSGEARAIPVSGDDARPKVVFSGAFHPVHRGHRRIAQIGGQLLGAPAAWELPIVNADKPPLDYLEVAGRLAQFEPGAKVWLTRAATFVEKADLFPGATFLVGVDTILRIDDPRFYAHSALARDAAFERIAAAGCRFLVFGRVRRAAGDAGAATFYTLSQLELSPGLQALCDETSAVVFREDVSSTSLRSGIADEWT